MVTATVTVPNGDELVLVYEGGRWRIDASAVDLYGQATPRQAIMGFLRAFERKRYDVILRYVPDAEREGLAGVGGLTDEILPSRPEPRADAADAGAPVTMGALGPGREGRISSPLGRRRLPGPRARRWARNEGITS